MNISFTLLLTVFTRTSHRQRIISSMPRLSASAIIEHPPAVARALLKTYMEQRRRGDGAICLPMRVALPIGGLDALALEHMVTIRFRSPADDDSPERVYYLEWAPSGDGFYPKFTGFMCVYALADPRSTRIEIDGTYTVPGGALGRAFDACFGHRIARTSLRDFVTTLATEINPAVSSTTRR